MKKRKFSDRTPAMTRQEYTEHIAALGLSQVAAGKFLGITDRTSRRFVAGDYPVPRYVALVLRLMVAWKISVEEANKLVGEPGRPKQQKKRVLKRS